MKTLKFVISNICVELHTQFVFVFVIDSKSEEIDYRAETKEETAATDSKQFVRED